MKIERHKLTILIPTEIMDRFRLAVHAQHRSVTTQIIMMMEAYLAEQDALAAARKPKGRKKT